MAITDYKLTDDSAESHSGDEEGRLRFFLPLQLQSAGSRGHDGDRPGAHTRWFVFGPSHVFEPDN
jgi:hypothetical protein